MNSLYSIWYFLGQYQTKSIRNLHIIIVLLVLAQIIISNWIKVTSSGLIPNGYHFFTYMHISIGCFLFILTTLLVITCFKQRGLFHYFPYLLGDLSQAKEDIKTLSKFKLPDSHTRGLAPIVQGLGLGALAIAIVTGVSWFIVWLFGFYPIAYNLENYHKTLVILIEIYLYAHGSFAVLHYIKWKKEAKST